MFTLTATPVEFVALLVMFGWSAVWEVRCLVTARGAVARTSSLAHLVMAVVMLLMIPHAWWMPFHQAVGLPTLIGVMALGMVWFLVRLAKAPVGHRSHPAVCAAMFATMVWHLWAMQVKMAHTMTMAMPASSSMDHSGMAGMDHSHMGGMSMGTSSWQVAASRPGHVMWWFALAGIVLVLVMLWVAVRDVVAAFATRTGRAGNLAEAAMCLGMAWMSTGLLAPVVPWIGYLSF